MTNPSRNNLLRIAASVLATVIVSPLASAQTPALQPRIGAIDSTVRATLPGTHSPRLQSAKDLGPVAASLPLNGITLVFGRTAAQESDLQSLLIAQQNPASPLFHQWLTPDQFGARFGLADSDISNVSAWLRAQGFTIAGVSRSRDRIRFNGTAAQVATAFGADLHNFQMADGTTHFAPLSDLSLPAALASNVIAVDNLNSFRPKAHIVRAPASTAAALAKPNFTSYLSGSHYLTPGDVQVIYDIGATYTGNGQSIAIIGQSFVLATDIANFQNAIGLTPKSPSFVLVPGSGSPEIYSGDETESDLDLEYSSSIASGATIYFVYTGNNGNYGAFDSIVYAVDQDLAPIISSSYGACEPALGSATFASLNSSLAQAAAQGQTVLSAAGDAGSTDCYGEYASTDPTDNEQLAVDFPASSQYVLAVGGTEFPTADTAVGNNTYWQAQGSTDVITSAKSYIPETAWNDDVAESGLASGGGGTSIYAPRPTWQSAAVPGIAFIAGSYRLVPDVSLDASAYSAPYAICTSDTYDWNSGQESSCSEGLRDASSNDLTLIGGTSVAAPIFAGMVAIINQAKGYTTGQGTMASTLYRLSTNSLTYASAFHDITSGSNECLVPADCSASNGGVTNFNTTTGYDEATGLGSVDFNNLLNAYPAYTTTSTLIAPTVTVTAASTTPAVSASDTITIAVTGSSGTPSGTVAIELDGSTVTTLNLTAGSASYSFSSATAGQHVITAVYSGNGVYTTGTGTLSLQVGPSFTLTSPNISVAAGMSVSSSFTITPINGYTGTVEYDLVSNSPGLNNACIGPTTLFNNGTAVTSGLPVTATFTIYTSTSACTAAGLSKQTLGTLSGKGGATVGANHAPPLRTPGRTPLLAALSAGLLSLMGLRKRRKTLAASLTLGLALVLSLGLAMTGLSGCSNSTAAIAPTTGGGTSSTGNATTGTYNVTVTGYDSSNAQLASTTNFTLTIH